jgi:hypothetical protein
MTERLQGEGHMSPPAKPNDNPLTDPTNAPLGTIVVWVELVHSNRSSATIMTVSARCGLEHVNLRLQEGCRRGQRMG